MNTIKVENLSKKYGSKEIISNLNLELNNQNIYFLTSENGSGKSTFFKCLLRETMFKGTIEDSGLVYTFLPEKVNLPPLVRVIDFLVMYSKLDNKQVNIDKIKEYLMLFGISTYENQYMNTLSKGTRQKVLIIKTLLSQADVYMFDEPLTGLDLKARRNFIEQIRKLNEEDKLILIATHYYDDYKFDNKMLVQL